MSEIIEETKEIKNDIEIKEIKNDVIENVEVKEIKKRGRPRKDPSKLQYASSFKTQEKFNDYHTKYYNEFKNEVVKCEECGHDYRVLRKSRHLKSNRHLGKERKEETQKRVRNETKQRVKRSEKNDPNIKLVEPGKLLYVPNQKKVKDYEDNLKKSNELIEKLSKLLIKD